MIEPCDPLRVLCDPPGVCEIPHPNPRGPFKAAGTLVGWIRSTVPTEYVALVEVGGRLVFRYFDTCLAVNDGEAGGPTDEA